MPKVVFYWDLWFGCSQAAKKRINCYIWLQSVTLWKIRLYIYILCAFILAIKYLICSALIVLNTDIFVLFGDFVLHAQKQSQCVLVLFFWLWIILFFPMRKWYSMSTENFMFLYLTISTKCIGQQIFNLFLERLFLSLHIWKKNRTL